MGVSYCLNKFATLPLKPVRKLVPLNAISSKLKHLERRIPLGDGDRVLARSLLIRPPAPPGIFSPNDMIWVRVLNNVVKQLSH